MKAPKTLRKPENWQDFETLCKKLWGEIWQCPEIKKNGRPGQTQSGVDVYGIPKDEDAYYGIQCKAKNEYYGKQLTKEEVNKEIKNALEFRPRLKKLFFATTASKDVEIETYIRTKNLENKRQGIFEVHIFSWEDIVDLIEENQATYDYYVNSIGFKTESSVEVTFQNDSNEILLTPLYRKRITHYQQEIVPKEINPVLDGLLDSPFYLAMQTNKKFADAISISIESSNYININYSYCPIQLIIKNTGHTPIENFKLLFEFEGEIADISKSNEEKVGFIMHDFIPRYSDLSLNAEKKLGQVIPGRDEILVRDDRYLSDTFFIKPLSKSEEKILINWKLISKHFQSSGELTLCSKPEIKTDHKTILVKDPLKVGVDQGEIEDYIEKKDDQS